MRDASDVDIGDVLLGVVVGIAVVVVVVDNFGSGRSLNNTDEREGKKRRSGLRYQHLHLPGLPSYLCDCHFLGFVPDEWPLPWLLLPLSSFPSRSPSCNGREAHFGVCYVR
jgi:hypothetical protein